MERAYSLLTVKSLDEDSRTITGIATTPKTDRMGDIVEPDGAEFSLPLPFLWQHNSREPIGHVTKAKVTADGIEIVAQLARTDEPGDLKNLLDKAWQSIKLKLVRGLSIGFSPIESADIKGSLFAQRFIKWEWLELSAVTIAANIDASITTIKSIDDEYLAASGHRPPGASGSVKLIPKQHPRGATMNITEQIQAFEHTRAAKAARRTELQEKASKEGRSKDEAERQEFDTITDELKSIDRELVDLRALEAENAATAKAVDASSTEAASASRGTGVTVKPEEKLEKGIEFARFAMCLGAAKGNVSEALALAQTHYPKQARGIEVLKAVQRTGGTVQKFIDSAIRSKAAVGGASTTDSAWAGTLLAYNTYLGDFIEFLRPQTIVGKFGQDGIPDFRRIPFNVHIKGRNAGGSAYWVGQGKAKPVTKFGFFDAYHGFFKVAAITVLDEEIIRFSDPSAERLVRDGLAEVAIEKIDQTFIDPAVAAVANVSPAAVTNGVAAIASSGATADDVRTDIQALWAGALAANLPLTGAVYITTPSIALALSLMMNPLGQREFPNMTMNGGTLLGVPAIVSNYVPAGTLVLAFASEIYFSDDGQATIDASKEATIEMNDAPAGDSVTPTAMASHAVSMFQTDSVALRMHRFINWSKRRTTAVALIEDVAWGGAAVS